MKKSASIGVWCLVALVVVLMAEVQDAAAVICNPQELSPCLGSLKEGRNPSPQCCAKLKENQACICYRERPYQPSPKLPPGEKSAGEVARECGITNPQCANMREPGEKV